MPGVEIMDSFELVHFGCIFPGKDIPSSPLDLVLQLVPEHTTMQDFFYFVFWFALNNNRSWGRCDLAW
jgi:hypothetical protein